MVVDWIHTDWTGWQSFLFLSTNQPTNRPTDQPTDNMKNIPRFSSKLTLLFLLATIFAIVVCGEETSSSSNKNEEEPVDSFNAKDHTDWGTYYDPKNIFCGKYDCYRILGFDYENYGTEKPTTRTITKRYRALSRAWHPDKSTHKDAKERFVVCIFQVFVLDHAFLCVSVCQMSQFPQCYP